MAQAKNRKPPAAGREMTVDAIYERMWAAISDHSLPSGTRLVEDRLAEVFGVGRTRVRQALHRLAHERVVTLMPNRGAMVAKPTIAEARAIFEARSIIEPAVVERLLAVATRSDLKRLREHYARQKEAWAANDRRATIKLSGEFHLVLAEIAGNQILLEIVRELVSRASLIIAVYELPGGTSSAPDEHGELVAALERSDHRAPELMRKHLQHVLEQLDLRTTQDEGIDLKVVFADVRP